MRVNLIYNSDICENALIRRKHMRTLDIVVPCYNEAECVELFYEDIVKTLSQVPDLKYSIIYVNDGSRDNTLGCLKKLAETHGNDVVKYISFSRNFGKESAIFAGLSYSTAEYVVLMDADLQHPSSLLPEMMDALEEGYDCCGARRVTREGEPIVRSFLSRTFYKIINKVTSMELVQGGSDFRMMKRCVVDSMLMMEERERFTKGIMSWVGFSTKWIEYENVERAAGETKWSMSGLVAYALSGFMAFATAPLRLAVYLGLVIDAITVVATIWFAIRTLTSDMPRTGYGTIVCLIAFFGGTIILLLGIIGEYMARIYTEVKKRPIFLVKDTNIVKTKELV